MPSCHSCFLFESDLPVSFHSDMQGTFGQSMPDVEQFLNFLHQLSDMGAAMRDVMTQVLTSPDMYSKLKEGAVLTVLFVYMCIC